MNVSNGHAAEYELVLMLDPEVPDENRDQIAADALRRIEAGGNLKDDRAWGMRKLAYEIRQRTEADYRFFRFESGGPLLEELDHSLKIADGVLRFRIFRVDPDTPVIEPPPPVALAGSASGRGGAGGRRGSDERASRDHAGEPSFEAESAPADRPEGAEAPGEDRAPAPAAPEADRPSA